MLPLVRSFVRACAAVAAALVALGAIAPGLDADLIAVEGDPVRDIGPRTT